MKRPPAAPKLIRDGEGPSDGRHLKALVIVALVLGILDAVNVVGRCAGSPPLGSLSCCSPSWSGTVAVS